MKFLAILFLFQALNASANNSKTIDVGLSDVPPYSYMRDGSIRGMHVDILKQIEKESGLNFNISLLPHARSKKGLETGSTDMLFVFRIVCEKYNQYEVIPINSYLLPPLIYLNESANPKKKNLKIARVIGTCLGLNKHGIDSTNIVEVASLDQGFKMIHANRIDGVCGNRPAVEFSINENKKFMKPLVVYKEAGKPEDYRGVVCLRKTLSPEIKNKIERAVQKITMPDFKKFI